MFNLGLYHLFKNKNFVSEAPFFCFFHDDGRALVKREQSFKILNEMNKILKEVGMELNFKKTKIYGKNISKIKNRSDRIHNILLIEGFNFDILGTYIGSKEETKKFLEKKTDKFIEFLKLLKKFKHKQTTWHVLHYCMGYSKYQNLLRTINLKFLEDFVLEIDKYTIDFIQDLVEKPLSKTQIIQISLPTSHGGLGVQALSTSNLAAALASWNQVKDNVYNYVVNEKKFFDDNDYLFYFNELNSLETKFFQKYEIEKIISEIGLRNSKTLNGHIADFQSKNLSKVPEDIARYNGCRANGASSWLFCSPIPYTRLNNQQFTMLLQFWLGVKICPDNINCRYCGSKMDRYAHHAIQCMRGPHMVKRHNQVRNFLYRKMKAAGWEVELEKKYLSNKDNTRPADIFVKHFSHGKGLAIDVSITSPMHMRIINSKEKKIGQASSMMIKIKNKKYEDIIRDGNLLFSPCVFEAMGGISPPANNLLRRLAQDLKMQMKKPYGYIMNLLKKTICIGIWKNNIEAIFEKGFWMKRDILKASMYI